MSRYVLCRPIGGLNDTLNQIERCWSYAEQFDRTLLIDTTRSGLGLAASTYFDLVDPAIAERVTMNPDDALLRQLDEVSCVPRALQGRITSYRSTAVPPHLNFVDSDSGVRLRFDFKSDYQETLLLHEQAGSGSLSLDFLTRVRPSAELRSEIGQRLTKLPAQRIGIHIRNTDLETNYAPFLNRLARQYPSKAMLVCSDDRKVVEASRAIFGSDRVVTSSLAPDFSGRPIHHEHVTSDARKFQLNAEMFSDLFALATSDVVAFTPTRAGKVSGFSRLAWLLHRNPIVHETFLSTEPLDPSHCPAPSKFDRGLPTHVQARRITNRLTSFFR